MENNKTLVIWHKSGYTSYFENVSQVEEFTDYDGATMLKFNYFGKLSQKKKTAKFQMAALAGYAIEQEEGEE